MIHNNKQLTQAKKEIELLIEKIRKLGNVAPASLELLQKVAWEKRINDLKQDVAVYIELMTQSELKFSKENLDKLVLYLRIASGLTQKQLAEAIGIKTQQIQRYEQAQYLNASFDRIIQILKELMEDVDITAYLKKDSKLNDFPHVRSLYPDIDEVQKRVIDRQRLVV